MIGNLKCIGFFFLLLLNNSISARTNQTKKILLVYYSYTGSTKKLTTFITNSIQKHIPNAILDIENIIAPDLNDTWLGKIKVALLSLWESSIEINKPIYDTENYDHIIICFPIWMGTISLPIQTYIAQYLKINNTKIHFCITYSGSAESVLQTSIKKFEQKTGYNIDNCVFISSDLLYNHIHSVQNTITLFVKKL